MDASHSGEEGSERCVDATSGRYTRARFMRALMDFKDDDARPRKGRVSSMKTRRRWGTSYIQLIYRETNLTMSCLAALRKVETHS